MDIEQIIEKQLTGCENWKPIAFTVACAERLFPIVDDLATETTKKLYQNSLESLWKLCLGENIDISDIMREIEETPEANEDDSHNPHYYVMRVLGVLVDAVKAAESDESIDNALSASIGMVNICGDIDYIVEEAGVEGIKPMEEVEIEVEKEVLALLNSADRPDSILRVQDYIKASTDLLRGLLPAFRKGNDWK